MYILVDKPTIIKWIEYFHVGDLTCRKMALMLLGRMVPSEELREDENENELLEKV